MIMIFMNSERGTIHIKTRSEPRADIIDSNCKVLQAMLFVAPCCASLNMMKLSANQKAAWLGKPIGQWEASNFGDWVLQT